MATIRVLFDISVPAATVASLQESLQPGPLPPEVQGRLEVVDVSAGCQSLARGGGAEWTPCWISLEADASHGVELAAALRRLKEAVVSAAREGGLEVFAVPATAQVGDGYHRLRDVLDVLDLLPG